VAKWTLRTSKLIYSLVHFYRWVVFTIMLLQTILTQSFRKIVLLNKN